MRREGARSKGGQRGEVKGFCGRGEGGVREGRGNEGKEARCRVGVVECYCQSWCWCCCLWEFGLGIGARVWTWCGAVVTSRVSAGASPSAECSGAGAGAGVKAKCGAKDGEGKKTCRNGKGKVWRELDVGPGAAWDSESFKLEIVQQHSASWNLPKVVIDKGAKKKGR